MNPFFDISKENNHCINKFQLKNLGPTMIMASIIGRNGGFSDYYRETTDGDYDLFFADTIFKWQPIYELEELLDYHYQYYTNNNLGRGDKFLKHLKFIVIPILEGRGNSKVPIDLIEDWLKSKQQFTDAPIVNNIINIRDINAPVQLQQNSNQSVQKQQHLDSEGKSILKAFELIKLDIQKLEQHIKSDFSMEMTYATAQINKDRDVGPQLKNIGKMMQQIGMGVFTNLAAAPIFEYIKPYLGL